MKTMRPKERAVTRGHGMLFGTDVRYDGGIRFRL